MKKARARKYAALIPGIALIGGMAAYPTIVPANEAGLYMGGGLGYFRINDDDFLDEDDDFKDNRWGWKVHVGAQLNPVFSVEGGYVDYGKLNDGPLELEADGKFAAALVHLLISLSENAEDDEFARLRPSLVTSLYLLNDRLRLADRAIPGLYGRA